MTDAIDQWYRNHLVEYHGMMGRSISDAKKAHHYDHDYERPGHTHDIDDWIPLPAEPPPVAND